MLIANMGEAFQMAPELAYELTSCAGASAGNASPLHVSNCRDEGPTVAALLDLNAVGQHAKLPIETMIKIYYIDHLKGVRPRLDIAHFKTGQARIS